MNDRPDLDQIEAAYPATTGTPLIAAVFAYRRSLEARIRQEERNAWILSLALNSLYRWVTRPPDDDSQAPLNFVRDALANHGRHDDPSGGNGRDPQGSGCGVSELELLRAALEHTLDEAASRWHETEPTVDVQPLHEWLGLTWEQYRAYMERGVVALAEALGAGDGVNVK